MDFTIKPPSKSFFLLIDLGTKIVKSAVVFLNKNDYIKELVFCDEIENQGFSIGRITNVREFKEILKKILLHAESRIDSKIEEVYINSSCDNTKSSLTEHIIDSVRKKITHEDIEQIYLKAKSNFSEAIIYSNAIHYTLDDINNIENPIEMYGKVLKAVINTVEIPKMNLLNIEHCFADLGVSLKGHTVSSYVSAIGSLLEEELSAQNIIVDIGYSSTSVSLFSKGVFLKQACIPIGGKHVTDDLSFAFSIPNAEAENLKVTYGKANFTKYTDPNERILIGNSGNKVASIIDIIDIIKPRIEEIIELSVNAVCKNGSFNNFVVCGGSGKISGLKELLNCFLDCRSRIAMPIYPAKIKDIYLKDMSYTAIAGLSKFILSSYRIGENVKQKSYFKRIVEIFS